MNFNDRALTFRQEVCGELDLGEVACAQLRLEPVEADPLPECHLAPRVLVVLVLPEQPLVRALLLPAAAARAYRVEAVLTPDRGRYGPLRHETHRRAKSKA